LADENYKLIFKALADDIRLEIIGMLNKNDLCACKILESFEITQPTLSYHMKALCESGLVSSRKEGVRIWYSLNKERLENVSKLLANLSSGGKVPENCDC